MEACFETGLQQNAYGNLRSGVLTFAEGTNRKKKSVNKKMPILNYLLSDLRDHSDLMKTSLY